MDVDVKSMRNWGKAIELSRSSFRDFAWKVGRKRHLKRERLCWERRRVQGRGGSEHRERECAEGGGVQGSSLPVASWRLKKETRELLVSASVWREAQKGRV